MFYTPGQFSAAFAQINKRLSKLSNSFSFLQQTEYYNIFEHEFLIFAQNVCEYFKNEQLVAIRNTGQTPRELEEQMYKIYQNQERFLVEANVFAKNMQTLATHFKFTQEYVQSPALDSLSDTILKMW